MNPNKAKEDISKKVAELNDIFQMSERAKVMANTEYWQIKKEDWLKEISDYKAGKSAIPASMYLSGYPIIKDGKQVGFKTAQEMIVENMTLETYYDAIRMVIKSVENAIEAGADAYKELQNYKEKLVK